MEYCARLYAQSTGLRTTDLLNHKLWANVKTMEAYVKLIQIWWDTILYSIVFHAFVSPCPMLFVLSWEQTKLSFYFRSTVRLFTEYCTVCSNLEWHKQWRSLPSSPHPCTLLPFLPLVLPSLHFRSIPLCWSITAAKEAFKNHSLRPERASTAWSIIRMLSESLPWSPTIWNYHIIQLN